MKGTHISKRSSRKLSRCNYGCPNATRPQVAQPLPGGNNIGLTPREFHLFHATRCELEQTGKRKVSSQEIRGAIALRAIAGASVRAAKLIESRKEAEDFMRAMLYLSTLKSVAVQQ